MSLKYKIKPSSSFKRELKKMKKQRKDISLLENVVTKLASGEPLPIENRDHPLQGDFKGCRECHIEPDWLLIYEISDRELLLYLLRTGSHSDLFGE